VRSALPATDKKKCSIQNRDAHALHSTAASALLRSHPQMTFRSGSYSYEIVSHGHKILYGVSSGKETLSEPVLYAFGDAHIARTYVCRHNGKLYEGRVSYYNGIDGLVGPSGMR